MTAAETTPSEVSPAEPRLGELPEQRTRHSITERLADGRLKTSLFTGPVNYRDEDGGWRRIDSSLVEDSAGAFRWRSKANAFEAKFAGAARGQFLALRVGGLDFRLEAVDAQSRAATATDATLTYPVAFTDTDLRYSVLPTGVKETIVLRSAAAPSSFEFRLSGPRSGPPVRAVREQDGSWSFHSDPVAGPLFSLERPTVTEHADGKTVAPPDPSVQPSMSVTPDGRDFMIRLSLDEQWLRAEGRRFPVELDPTVTIQPDVEDVSWASNGNYFPSLGDRLFIGTSANYVWRAGLQFDLGAIPAGANVADARLGLYFDDYCISGPAAHCGGVDHVIGAHRMTAPWGTSTPSSQVSFDGTAAANFTFPTNPQTQWMTWNLTNLVRSWLAGTQPNHGLLLKRQTEPLNVSGPAPPGRRFTAEATLQPKLEVTYSSDAVDLLVPDTLHGNGAELVWTRYTGPSGAPFLKYEVHRSAAPGFTPNGSTLLTTISDVNTTTYRDTTAAPGKAFTYRVVANGDASNWRTVTLPADGQVSKRLQPDTATGQTTYLYYSNQITNCGNYGTDANAWLGTSTTAIYRPVQRFNLAGIPPSATVTGATMSLWADHTGSGTGTPTVEAHRLTRPWKEGTGDATCTGNGATWYETEGGQKWTTTGGDFDAAVAASVTTTASAPPNWHNFDVKSLVQQWVNGTAPNNGVLLKLTDETLRNNNSLYYRTDDWTVSPTLRPKLTVTFSDASSYTQGPRVSVSAPGADATVTGSTVPFAASAADDRRVDKVEFLVDGAVVGSDTTAPFGITWNSTTKANGQHQLSAKATDDAGNVTTSQAVSVTVDNTALPDGSLTAPADNATVAGSVTLSASASDDVGVTQVEFLVDGARVGAPDSTAPHSIAWNTLDPLARIFDGDHQITAVVTDTSGQQYETAARTVTLDNRSGSVFSVGFDLNDTGTTADDVFPAAMTENQSAGALVQDPYAGTVKPDGTSGGSLGRSLTNAPTDDSGGTGGGGGSCAADAYCPTVTVSNTSGSAWQNSQAQLWYRWYADNGAILYEGRVPGSFPATFGKNASQTFALQIHPPKLPPGAEQGSFRLRVDLYDPVTGAWFTGRGNPPLDNPVIVTRKLAGNLGLERFWQYDGEPAGAGMTTLTNVANGNLLLRWTPFFAPGRGLATMVDLTYNSLEDHSKSPAGNNMSLAISGLIRIGEPLDIHPNKADEISGHSNKWVQFTDADGTVHRFTGTTQPDGSTTWAEPPGVNLYLRSVGGSDPNRQWALTRPDKVTFFFDADGFPTAVEDRNGNTLTFTLQDTPAGEDPGGPKKRIIRVTDAGGRYFVVDYWSKAEAKKAHVRGKIQRITDHSGSALDFDYYDDGNLLRLTQRGGTTANGEFLADRSFVFTYTNSKGDGAAIADPAARANPEPKTPNQSTRLFSVRDPRGTETTFAYFSASDPPQLRWKLKSRTNRAGEVTSVGYDITNRVTTVTAPLSRATAYTYDTSGKVTRIVDPLNQATAVEWTSDFKVSKVTEPTGRFSSYTYNGNGYLTSSTNQVGEKTVLDYVNESIDARDTAGHLSLLTKVTKPKGVATTAVSNDFQWSFGYDSAGNVDKVTDPTGAVTDYDYNLAGSAHPGTIARVRDPNAHTNGTAATEFPSYDSSGQPTQIVDPEGNVTRFGYDIDGLLRWTQDPNHAGDSGTDERAYKAFFDYDTFHRLGRQSAPKSTATNRGALIWSGADFDPNDNIVTRVDPHDGSVSDDLQNAPTSATSFDTMDRPLVVANSDKSVDSNGERTGYAYDAAGRVAKVTGPKGVLSATVDDFATVFAYDPLDRILRQTAYGTSTSDKRITHLCYDIAGDLRSVTAPRAGLASVTCPGNGPATVSFTTTFEYDAAHRLVKQRDPLGHEQRTGYDANGNVSTSERDIDTASGKVERTTTSYDQRDLPVEVRQRFTSTRDVVSRFEYDPSGNRTRLISPRAYDAGGGAGGTYTNFVTSYAYDKVNRLVRITLPFNAADGSERQYVHRSYDPNGNLASVSLPVTSSSAGAVGNTARTQMSYFDPGWIRTSDDPVNPTLRFDYTAQGWQAERVADKPGQPGVPDETNHMFWTYFADGRLASRTDQGGQPSTFSYDANNNLTAAVDNGISDPAEKAIETRSTYNGFDQPAKVRNRKAGSTAWRFSDYTYDTNGNVTVRRENGEETDAGSQTKSPRRYEFTYDAADWLTRELDLGVDSACKDDQRIVPAFWASGWEKQRDVYRAGATCTADFNAWPRKQTTTWTYFDNGKLNTLVTKNGAGATTESHTVGYTDPSGFYVNGNRTTDRYWMLRQAGKTGVTTCLSTAPCDAKYTYDARDRLTSHQIRAGKTNTYTLDEPAKLIGDTTIRAGNITTEVKNGTTTTRKYQANQLKEATTGTATAKYWYDPLGNLDCVTLAAGSQANCSPSDDAGSASTNLVADYGYDYLNRLAVFRAYTGGTRTDKATYTYDALDRTVKEVEDHAGTGKDRATAFSYQGLTQLVTEERQTGGTNPATKTFAYDAYGRRIGLTDTVGTTVTTYTYGHDVHGSVSQLLTDAGAVRASYGYDAYGGADAPASDTQALTTGDTDNQAPLNPYRYTDRRIDSGTATSAFAAAGYDMGARRYGPDTTRFLQGDIFHGALANLGLTTDPLTQNRYALAGGNPISYIETDGHIPSADGSGGAAPAPTPTTGPTSPDAIERWTTSQTGDTGAAPQTCWQQLACNRDDIASMSVDNRKRMIEWIQSHDRDPEAYFNAILALLDFAGDEDLIEPGRIGEGNWFSSLDAVILEGIHDGFALSRGGTGAMYTDLRGGAEAWQRFFQARKTDPGNTDLARSLWGRAEQKTTNFAHQLVGKGSEREEIFLEYGNTWRKTLRESYRVEGLDVCEWEWCEPLIFVLDPRSYNEVRAGADVLWRGAWFEAALPDWM